VLNIRSSCIFEFDKIFQDIPEGNYEVKRN
jgi:hypothetical protein